MTRVPGLDTLRAIAIVWVMLFHSYLIGGLGERFGLLERSGWMGVDLFFVLSGYLIGSQVLKSLKVDGRLNFLTFYSRRATRILPAFLVVLALYALWPAWRETPHMQPLWQFFTFTFNLLFDNSNNYAFSHVWSLCVEEHFYLLFPLLALLLTRRPAAWKFITVCLGVVVGGIALRAGLWMHFVAPSLQEGAPSGLIYLRYLYYPTYARLDGLVAGVALAACAVHRPAWMTALRSHTFALLGFSAVSLAAALTLFDGARTQFWPCVLGYPLVALAMGGLVAAASGGSPLARLNVPAARWLAGISYSLYLCHKGVFTLLASVLGDHLARHGLIRFALFAAVTLAGGALLHYVVERPFLHWRDHRTGSSVPASGRQAIATDHAS
jgi:peptidoglycan/LPS O-acetylase OafA/YrhL